VEINMQAKAQDILLERRDLVGWVTFNRPDRFNAFDYDSFGQLADVVEELGHDPKIGVIVLTGAGDKSFCAGGYLGDLTHFNAVDARKLYDLSQRCFQALRRAPQPVIAAVNGFAIGGGNELVICSDLAIASEHARFGQAGPRIGSSPIFGGNNLLALTIGEKKAREVCYMCRQYSAQEALAMGWINKVVPHSQLQQEVQAWCEELLDKAPGYLELTKMASNVWWDMTTPTMELSKQVLLRMAGGAQMTEGASAFMQKRTPDFRQFRK
jgi:2-ketocyclohexanecarboxyl-CoA hydrolase